MGRGRLAASIKDGDWTSVRQAINRLSAVVLGSEATPTFAGITLGNTGLHLLDTDESHDLIIKPGSNLTADRTLTLTTGDADRTITLSGNPTLDDWFDQSVKVAASPVFAGLTLTGLSGVLKASAGVVAGSANHGDLNDMPSSAVSGHDGRYPTRAEWLQNGFPNRDDSSISFDDGTRRFTINPSSSSFDYFVVGVKYTVSSSDVLNVNYVYLGDTPAEGLWYIYYDGPTLIATVSPNEVAVRDIYENKAIVAIVFWNADSPTKGQLLEDRHGLSMSPFTHILFHDTIGTRFDNGLALNNITADGTGDLDDLHAQFGVDAGQIFDEDIEHTLNAIGLTTGLQIWYKDASGWTFTTNAGFSMITTGTGRLAYNNGNALAEVEDNDFVLCHVFATSMTHLNPIVAIGQAEYATKKLAQQGALTEIINILAPGNISPELKPIASVIFQTKNTYSNAVKARIVSTDEGDDYVDFRTDILTPAFSSAQTHGNLAGLGNDDHVQYIKDAEFTQDSGILVGTAAGTFQEETGATLRTSLGLGTGDTPTFTTLVLSTIAAEGSDVDKFLVDSSDTIKYRTGVQVLSDIGASASGHNHSGVYQPLDAELTSLALLSYAAASFVKMTGANTFALRTIGETADDLEGTIVHDNLASIPANDHIDHTGVDITAGTGLTGGGDISSTRTLAVDGVLEDLDTLGAVGADSEFLVGTGAGVLAWESGTTLRTSLGLGTGDSPQFTGIELGHASDTTITRASAGNLNIESKLVYRADGTDVPIGDGGTGQSTAQTAINALSAVSGATNEHVLTKDTSTGNATWKAAAGGGGTFVALTDTPANYTAAAKKLLSVNDAGNAVIFCPQIYWDTANDRFILGTNTMTVEGGLGDPLFVVESLGVAGPIARYKQLGTAQNGKMGFYNDDDVRLGFGVGGTLRAGVRQANWGILELQKKGTAEPAGIKIQTKTAVPISFDTNGDNQRVEILGDGGVKMYSLKSGANQGAAGAAANELWHDTDNNAIKLGV